MSLSTDHSLTNLREAAKKAEDERLESRLGVARRIIGEDLAWVESLLSQASEQGTAPASDAARHLIQRGGKRIRPMALLLSAACFEGVTLAARELAVVVELVHSATLLHDDVIDDGIERRGARTARLIWGNAVSVLSGDFLLVQALERTFEHAPTLMGDLLSTLRTLVDGEIVQLRGRARLDTSELTYERVLRDKTASLFRFATFAGARLGGASLEQAKPLTEFGEALGIAFQLVDDALDYTSESSGKTLFADLREGKVTLPLVLASQSSPDLLGLLERIHAGDETVVTAVRERVMKSDVCAEVRRRAREYTNRALRALTPLPTSPAKGLLESVARELAERSM